MLVAARDATRTEAFAREIADRFGIDAAAVASIREGAAAADVITAVTNASEPVLYRAWVRPGTHVNAVGAIAPAAVEVDPADPHGKALVRGTAAGNSMRGRGSGGHVAIVGHRRLQH